jgi:tetratricopeptide (TPR) repeat protein
VCVCASLLFTFAGITRAQSDLGAALVAHGEYSEAAKAYEKELKHAPDRAKPGLKRSLALAYYQSGRLADAALLLNELHTSAPADKELTRLDAKCNFRLGVASWQASKVPESVKFLARAAALDPSIPHVHSHFGRALLFSGDAEGALDAFRKQLAIDTKDYEANFYGGQILAIRRRFAEAQPLFERAARLRPDSFEAQDAVEQVRSGHFKRPGPSPSAVPPGAAAPVMELGTTRLPLPEPGKPAVLVFGSYTCPNFRVAAPELNNLARRYGPGASFLMVYIREAHSTDLWQSTINERQHILLAPAANLDQKQQYAAMCVRKLHLAFPSVVDGIDGTAEKAYGAWPNRVYVIDPNGKAVYSSGLSEIEFDPEALEAMLETAVVSARR